MDTVILPTDSKEKILDKISYIIFRARTYFAQFPEGSSKRVTINNLAGAIMAYEDIDKSVLENWNEPIERAKKIILEDVNYEALKGE